MKKGWVLKYLAIFLAKKKLNQNSQQYVVVSKNKINSTIVNNIYIFKQKWPHFR